jgi:hypothetical protein
MLLRPRQHRRRFLAAFCCPWTCSESSKPIKSSGGLPACAGTGFQHPAAWTFQPRGWRSRVGQPQLASPRRAAATDAAGRLPQAAGVLHPARQPERPAPRPLTRCWPRLDPDQRPKGWRLARSCRSFRPRLLTRPCRFADSSALARDAGCNDLDARTDITASTT